MGCNVKNYSDQHPVLNNKQHDLLSFLLVSCLSILVDCCSLSSQLQILPASCLAHNSQILFFFFFFRIKCSSSKVSGQLYKKSRQIQYLFFGSIRSVVICTEDILLPLLLNTPNLLQYQPISVKVSYKIQSIHYQLEKHVCKVQLIQSCPARLL